MACIVYITSHKVWGWFSY